MCCREVMTYHLMIARKKAFVLVAEGGHDGAFVTAAALRCRVRSFDGSGGRAAVAQLYALIFTVWVALPG